MVRGTGQQAIAAWRLPERAQLKAAIQEFIDAHQADPKPFVWTKTADEILASIVRFAQRTLETAQAAEH